MAKNKEYLKVDLKPHQPLKVPLLLFLAIVGVSALIAIGIYEWVF